MTTKRQHRHWVTAIETRTAIEPKGEDPYGGIRLMVHHQQADAMADLKEWLEDELDEKFDTAEEAIQAYTDRTGKRIIVEEQYA